MLVAETTFAEYSVWAKQFKSIPYSILKVKLNNSEMLCEILKC